jgi:hypothetical protein
MQTHAFRGLSALLASLLILAGCGDGHHDADPQAAAGEQGRKVATTGKEATALGEVPDDVLQAARSVRPELEIGASEYEVRDGREYYDLAGRRPRSRSNGKRGRRKSCATSGCTRPRTGPHSGSPWCRGSAHGIPISSCNLCEKQGSRRPPRGMPKIV